MTVALNKAAARAGSAFALDRLSSYSRADILAELNRVAALTNHPHLTMERFRAASRCNAGTIYKYFASWGEALAGAGLSHRFSGKYMPPETRKRAARRMSDGQLLDLLRRVAARRGDGVVACTDLRREEVGPNVYRRRFGGWRRALKRAGLKASGKARVYTDRECWENLRRMWSRLGRPPRVDEMAKAPSKVGPQAYYLRFGTWRRCLAYFAEHANDDNAPMRLLPRGKSAPWLPHRTTDKRNRHPEERAQASVSKDEGPFASSFETAPFDKLRGPPQDDAKEGPLGVDDGKRPTRRPPTESASVGAAALCDQQSARAAAEAPNPTARHVPWSLRYRVLARDHFKCTACGNSPATDPACRLHVDHVLAYSQGGRTEPGNLATLCHVCNVGKGDSKAAQNLAPTETR